ncbi:nucleoside/nucleotide kinase family protein [Actinorhabdospora filicis]|uniref:nucleoside/nucleotide kinase family protein n=1 Tax=Actinorhabdospora filicis TaxID=1785913 RepID=UPI002556C9C0|nr:nucleoside/nucleotide kinase family protein [Actinorhabdospora filicis]
MAPAVIGSVTACVERAARLAASGGRRVLGVVGAPGAGKSTIARRVVAALGAAAVYVPMDGFHLAQTELARLGRAGRKGAPDTFDADGYVALLRRLREPGGAVVYAPEFRRDLEEPIAGAVPVPPGVPLVVTEGNYLLLDEGPFAGVAALLDESWYVEVEDGLRLARLVERHRVYGKSPEAAREWAHGSDERNAALVAASRGRADVVVRP